MMKFHCSSCGHEYHVDHAVKWGMTLESQSYGPRPICTALIPDAAGGNGVCRGMLFRLSATPEEVAKLNRPRPIEL